MSATTSATTGRRYGIQRVCQAWERSRSTHYARRARARRRERGEPARRGPTPAHSDEQLLAAVRADLARSPFQGEGHRKVHARLRILDGIRVARTRVLRAHGLLSPHRGRQGDPAAPRRDHHHRGPSRHVGDRRRAGVHGRRRLGLDLRGGRPLERGVRRVGTCARSATGSPPSNPSRMAFASGTARWTPTSPAGWPCGWTMAANICRTTSSIRSGTGASVPASASSRNPKRTASRSGGTARSRSKRCYGRAFQRLDDVRAAVADFVERYNQSWRLEKLGYQTPIEAREAYELRPAA